MATFSIGCVPYVNALPLIWSLRERDDITIRFDVPSALPHLLDTGEVEAILVSSFDAITKPGRQAVDGVCIGSQGDVESVRLFSKVPFSEIGSLALDSSSMTSNGLARIVLAKQFEAHPRCFLHAPHLEKMLESCDACVLIGDEGMRASGHGLHVLDLGAAWRSRTRLPFVWALWVGNQIPDELSAILVEAPRTLRDTDFEDMASEASRRTGLGNGRLLSYLTETIEYRLDTDAVQGLEMFAREVKELEGIDVALPEWVGSIAVAKAK